MRKDDALALLKILKILPQYKKLMAGIIILSGIILLGTLAPLLTPYSNPVKMLVVPRNLPPSLEYVLGTDDFGRDVFAQFVYGTRYSLIVGFIAGVIGIAIGVSLGFLAGLRPGLIDSLVTRVIDIFLVIPVLPLIVIIASVVPRPNIYLVGIVIGIFSWPGAARAIRAQVISLRERDFINLAKLSGLSDIEVLFTEILPNMLSYIGAVFAGTVSGAILSEAGISLLGLGPVEVPTLGKMISESLNRGALMRNLWWWFFPPVVCLILIFIALQSINMGLDEIYNPRLRK